jgi:parallel beta-helix repeat protein/predicted outer membrane repeat protein
MKYPLLILALLTSTTLADTWTVDDDGLDFPKADFDNIQAAVDAAAPTDEIIVYPGTYTSNDSAVVHLGSSDAHWLHSSDGPESTIIDGQGARIGVHFNQTPWGQEMKLEGFTIKNSYSSEGGGIRCTGCSPLILDCIITDNSGSNGAGIYTKYYSGDSSPEIRGCHITNNTANGEGGGIFITGSNAVPTIIDCVISGNSAGTDGGGICTWQAALITGCSISDNTATSRGGGIFGDDASVGDCEFVSNTAASGGAVFCTASMYIGNCVVCENIAPQLMGPWIDVGENQISEFCGSGACCTGNQAICVMSIQTDCEHFGGIFQGYGFDCGDVTCQTSCFGDITGDGVVNVSDLLAVIAVWGACP